MTVAAAPPTTQFLLLERFPLPWLARALSPNGRTDERKKTGPKRLVHTTVLIEGRKAGIRPVRGPVDLTLVYTFPDHRRRDLDNYSSGISKAVQDALVRAGWIDGDDSGTVASYSVRFRYERGERKLLLAIAPVGEQEGQTE